MHEVYRALSVKKVLYRKLHRVLEFSPVWSKHLFPPPHNLVLKIVLPPPPHQILKSPYPNPRPGQLCALPNFLHFMFIYWIILLHSNVNNHSLAWWTSINMKFYASIFRRLILKVLNLESSLIIYRINLQ